VAVSQHQRQHYITHTHFLSENQCNFLPNGALKSCLLNARYKVCYSFHFSVGHRCCLRGAIIARSLVTVICTSYICKNVGHSLMHMQIAFVLQQSHLPPAPPIHFLPHSGETKAGTLPLMLDHCKDKALHLCVCVNACQKSRRMPNQSSCVSVCVFICVSPVLAEIVRGDS